ncbi:MAG: ribosome maturation factor RimP [Acidobacteriia bacterium]|nr:ribosome maturation factor RimP [Terriglobia bacterium]
MPLKTKEEMIAAVERLATKVVEAAGLELFEVELKGTGRSHYLRVYIDKPILADAEPGELPPDVIQNDVPQNDVPQNDVPQNGVPQNGVTHEDCERVSRDLGELMDQEDPIPGTYSLEVSSPGVERPLKKWQDWNRFRGQSAKVVLREPLEDGKLKSFDGVILETSEADRTVTVELGKGHPVTFPFDLVSKAHLKFEW